MVDWAHPVKATHNATKAAAGLQHGRLFLVHLVLGLLLLGLDGLEHLLGLLGGDSGLALRLRLLVLVLLVLILILVLVLILILILVLVLILLVLVLVLILVLVVIPATAAVRIVLQHLPGIDIVFLRLHVVRIDDQRLCEGFHRRAVLLLLQGGVADVEVRIEALRALLLQGPCLGNVP